MDRLLAQVNGDVSDGRYSAVVAGPSSLVDLLFMQIGGAPIELVIDGNDSERTAALAIATSGVHRSRRLSDIASDQSAERLRQLSDEVSRIASTLARLSTDPGAPARPAHAVNDDSDHARVLLPHGNPPGINVREPGFGRLLFGLVAIGAEAVDRGQVAGVGRGHFLGPGAARLVRSGGEGAASSQRQSPFGGEPRSLDRL
jgi:hypothetical protein